MSEKSVHKAERLDDKKVTEIELTFLRALKDGTLLGQILDAGQGK